MGCELGMKDPMSLPEFYRHHPDVQATQPARRERSHQAGGATLLR